MPFRMPIEMLVMMPLIVRIMIPKWIIMAPMMMLVVTSTLPQRMLLMIFVFEIQAQDFIRSKTL